MPPRKPAAEKASADEAPTLILNYLIQQNRPYSATDVSSNLHNKVTKTKTDKILKELAEEGKIVGKNAGKAWIFHALQVGFILASGPFPIFLSYIFLRSLCSWQEDYDVHGI